MKSFIFKIQENGKADFIDEKDRAVYKRLLSSIKNSGRDKIRITVELVETSKTNENQMKLFRVLVVQVSKESGSDYSTVETTLVNNLLHGKLVSELTNQEFSDFLEQVIIFCNEFFNLNVSFNEQTNLIEINKIR